MRFTSILLLLLLAVTVYPLALLVQLGFDTLWGDGEFLDVALNGRKRVLTRMLLDDWLGAAPMIAGVIGGMVLLALAGKGNAGLGWVYRGLLLLLVASPVLPVMPLMMGLVLALSAAVAGLWTWRAAP